MRQPLKDAIKAVGRKAHSAFSARREQAIVMFENTTRKSFQILEEHRKKVQEERASMTDMRRKRKAERKALAEQRRLAREQQAGAEDEQAPEPADEDEQAPEP